MPFAHLYSSSQLINSSSRQTAEPLPYAFHLTPRPSAQPSTSTAPRSARLQINASIQEDILTSKKPGATEFSPEDVFEVVCEPQAVFRVRSVGRCSSTLSGEFHRGQCVRYCQS